MPIYAYIRNLELKHKEKMKELENKICDINENSIDEMINNHIENKREKEILNEIKSRISEKSQNESK